jgi:precorrin-3B synthase
VNTRARGACPTLCEPMPTGDGLLVRLVPIATIALGEFAALCKAARRFGNGIIEITARGNIQVRGLSERSAGAFAQSITISVIDEPGNVALMIDPLAGLAPGVTLDAGMLADRLRAAFTRSALSDRLGPKVSVLIDGGTTLHLDRIAADVRLRTDSGGERYHVAVGGNAENATPLGMVSTDDAVELVLRLLETIASRGRGSRARQIVGSEGVEVFSRLAAGLVVETECPAPRGPAAAIGQHQLRDGSVAVGFGLAFGHATADALEQLVAAVARAQASGIRTAPHRTLLVIGVEPAFAPTLVATAQRLGFVTSADDRRLHIAACAGKPLCASGGIATRALAPTIAAAAGRLLDGTILIHLSGCAKGCAHAGAAALTVVGDGELARVIVDGSPNGPSVANLRADDLSARLARLAHKVDAVAAPGEGVGTVLARLGADRIAAVLQETSDA